MEFDKCKFVGVDLASGADCGVTATYRRNEDGTYELLHASIDTIPGLDASNGSFRKLEKMKA